MDIKLKQNGCIVQICGKCSGWGVVEEILRDTTRIYTTCTVCNGAGRLLKKQTVKFLKLVVEMNTDFNKMPEDTVVQVKIKIKATNTTVWTLASKSKTGEFDIRGFKTKECDLIGWREL